MEWPTQNPVYLSLIIPLESSQTCKFQFQYTLQVCIIFVIGDHYCFSSTHILRYYLLLLLMNRELKRDTHQSKLCLSISGRKQSELGVFHGCRDSISLTVSKKITGGLYSWSIPVYSLLKFCLCVCLLTNLYSCQIIHG